MRKNAGTEKPNKLSQIREDDSEQKSYSSEQQPKKRRIRFASSDDIEEVSADEGGEDEIEEIEDSEHEIS